MTLRVCLVSPLPPPYGGISHWTKMIEKYAGESDAVELQVLNTAPTWREIHDTAIWKRAVGGAFQLLRDLVSFLVILFKWKPNAVHLTTSGQLALVRDIVILLLSRVVKVNTVYHIRFGRIPDILRYKSKESLFFRMAASLAHHIIAIDKATYDALVGRFGASKVSLISNCYDPIALPSFFSALQAHSVVFLGWVIPSKGVEELIDAWMSCESSDWTLSIIGPGDALYIDILKQRTINKNVEYLGSMKHPDAMIQLNKASIFVLPSHTEGFPNVIVEAMAMGKAIIATDVGAIPEMLGSDRGVLVPSRDIEKLANALKSVMDNELLRENLGLAAREFAQSHYSIQSVFQSYLALWSNEK